MVKEFLLMKDTRKKKDGLERKGKELETTVERQVMKKTEKKDRREGKGKVREDKPSEGKGKGKENESGHLK